MLSTIRHSHTKEQNSQVNLINLKGNNGTYGNHTAVCGFTVFFFCICCWWTKTSPDGWSVLSTAAFNTQFRRLKIVTGKAHRWDSLAETTTRLHAAGLTTAIWRLQLPYSQVNMTLKELQTRTMENNTTNSALSFYYLAAEVNHTKYILCVLE